MYHMALTLHIIGIVLLAGAIFMDFVFTRYFWKTDGKSPADSATVLTMIEKMQKIMGIGGLLTILAGVWMISLVRVWSEQPWFHLKMGILLLVLFNALFFRKRLGRTLHIEAERNSNEARRVKLKNNLNAVQLTQLIFLVTMFVLSVFKFN